MIPTSVTTIRKGGVVGVEEAEVVDVDVAVEEEAGVEEDPMITTTAITTTTKETAQKSRARLDCCFGYSRRLQEKA